jgi:Ca2+/Na+ antiporter
MSGEFLKLDSTNIVIGLLILLILYIIFNKKKINEKFGISNALSSCGGTNCGFPTYFAKRNRWGCYCSFLP